MAHSAEGGCCRCCCSFIFTSGLTALFMWLSLRTSNPTCSIQEFYVPALNKTQNFTNNHTISFHLRLANGMKDKGVYYSNISLTFFYREKNYNVSIANYTIQGFYQGHKKKANRIELVEASGLPWAAALDTISNGSTVNFTVGLATMVKFKIMFWHTKKHRLVVRGDVAVNDSGKNVKKKELDGILRDYVGRESPLYFAERLTEHYKRPDGKGPRIYLKREDLNHTGAHKINNAVAQALLAKRLGKKRIIAETGAGQHGVATATVCARFDLQCVVYMGAQDMERQALNVFRMRLLGAEVRAVHSGTATLKDATSEAIRDWVTNVESTHYILGSVAGPHPYPMMVREFHAVIGKETRKQALEKWGGKPDVLVACVGGGSNAMGLFHEFVDDKDVRLIGVEAAGFGLDSGKHAATLTKGDVGVLHGAMSYLLQDDDGQIIEPHSISAGLDYPGVGPEHSFLKDIGRAEYYSITDEEALEAFKRLSRLEGIIPALETSHALAYLEKLCPTLPDGTKVVLNCSGRGDKDVQTAIKHLDL